MLSPHILRSLPSLLLGLALGLLWGCSSDAPTHPEAHARHERIVDAVENLRTAYVERDIQAVNGLLLPLGDLQGLKEDMRKDFEVFSDIMIEFSIVRINIKGDQINVFVHWQGDWKKTPDDSGTNVRGQGILQWSGTQVILLSGIDGDLPFGMASRQA